MIADIARGKTLSCLVVAILASAATQSVWARNQYWTDANKDHKWSTSGNWSGNTSLNAEFRRSWFNPDEEGKGYAINIDGDQTASWKLYVCAIGSKDIPLVFRNTGPSNTLTVGDSSTAGTGYLIAYDEGDAALRLESGKYMTTTAGGWFIGSADYRGYVTVGDGATLGSSSKFELKNGLVTVEAGGAATMNTWCAVGNLASKAGTLVIDGGTVENKTNRMTIGDVADSTGEVIVKNGGKYSNTGASTAGLTVGQKAKGTLEVVDGGEVDIGERTLNVCAEGSATANVNIKVGGTVKMKGFVYGSGAGGAMINIDGGTIHATADNDAFIPNNAGLAVTVGVNGGTIDTAGKNVTIARELSGVGTLLVTGGGILTFTAAPSIKMLVTPGTKISASKEIAATILANGLGLAGIPDLNVEYTILTSGGDLSAEGSLDVSKVTCGIASSFSAYFGDGGTSVVVKRTGDLKSAYWTGAANDNNLSTAGNWSDVIVPASGNATIALASSSILSVGDTFAPSSITFDSMLPVTIDGRDLVNVAAVTNMSGVSHTIKAKVFFTSGINVKQDAMSHASISEAHVTFAGGAYAGDGKTIDSGYSVAIFGKYHFANTAPWTATEEGSSRKSLADNAELYVPIAGDTIQLYIHPGARLFIGAQTLSGQFRELWRNYGQLVVTNLTVSHGGDTYLTWSNGTEYDAVFRFGSVTNAISTDNWLYFGDANLSSKQTIFFGAGGLVFDSKSSSKTCVCFGNFQKNNTQTTIRPLDSNFILGKNPKGDGNKIAFDNNVVFNTDDEDGVGHVIELAAKTRSRNSPTITVSGKGTLKVNKACENVAEPPVMVTDTATLEFASGASLGSGPITLGAGATLVLSQPNGESAFASIANTINLPTEGSASVRIDGARLKSGEHEIAAVGTGTTANIALDLAGSALAGRRAALRVENGMLKLDIKPVGLMIIFK